MAETRQLSFTYQELAEILVKSQGIREGFWGISFELALAACPTTPPVPPPGAAVVPGVMVLINKVGIMRFDQPNALTVDASKVNSAS